jgi:hypothetical protein
MSGRQVLLQSGFSGSRVRRHPQDWLMPDPEGARSTSPGLLESNPWRRLTISEHRGHLLPETEDIFCRAARPL